MLVLWHNHIPQALQFDTNEVKLLLKVLRKLSFEQLEKIGLSVAEIDKLNTLVVEMQSC